MARGKRIVSEVQNIKVRKYQYVKPEPEPVVQQKVSVSEPSPGIGGIFGLKRKKKPKAGADRAAEFVEVLER